MRRNENAAFYVTNLGSAASGIGGTSGVESVGKASVGDTRALVVVRSAGGTVADDTNNAKRGLSRSLANRDNVEVLNPGSTRGATTHVRSHEGGVGDGSGADLTGDGVQTKARVVIARIAINTDMVAQERKRLPAQVASVVTSVAASRVGVEYNEAIVCSIGNTSAAAEPSRSNVQTGGGPSAEGGGTAVVGGDDEVAAVEVSEVAVSRVDTMASSGNNTAFDQGTRTDVAVSAEVAEENLDGGRKRICPHGNIREDSKKVKTHENQWRRESATGCLP